MTTCAHTTTYVSPLSLSPTLCKTTRFGVCTRSLGQNQHYLHAQNRQDGTSYVAVGSRSLTRVADCGYRQSPFVLHESGVLCEGDGALLRYAKWLRCAISQLPVNDERRRAQCKVNGEYATCNCREVESIADYAGACDFLKWGYANRTDVLRYYTNLTIYTSKELCERERGTMRKIHEQNRPQAV